jgi:hypothetical protein
MPEQVKMLRDYWEEEKKQKKPLLDEQEIEIINQNLSESLQDSTPILFKIFKNGFLESLGPVTVLQIDIQSQTIKVMDDKEYIHFVQFNDVVGSELL